MKGFTYFSILILGTIFGYLIIGVLLSPVKFYAYKLMSELPLDIIKLILYVFMIPQLAFGIFIIFRLYLCIKNKAILLPNNFTGGKYITSAIASSIFWIALILTIVALYAAPIGGMSGVPLGMVLIPVGFIAIYIVLKCELPAIKEYRETNS